MKWRKGSKSPPLTSSAMLASLQATATLEFNSPPSSSNPVFLAEHGVTRVKYPFGQFRSVFPAVSPPSFSLNGWDGMGCKDSSRRAAVKKVNSILARPSTPSLWRFLCKIQHSSCFPHCLHTAPVTGAYCASLRHFLRVSGVFVEWHKVLLLMINTIAYWACPKNIFFSKEF